MLKKIFVCTSVCLSLIMASSKESFSQEKTKEELIAEADAMKSKMAQEKAKERAEKIKALKEPKTSGVGSIDDLATNTMSILKSTLDLNKQIPELYKRTIGESVDGVTDVTVKKPTIDELTVVLNSLGKQILAVTSATTALATATTDVKSASPLQAPKAAKSVNFSKEALALAGPELQLNLKVVKNLIEIVKTAKNY